MSAGEHVTRYIGADKDTQICLRGRWKVIGEADPRRSVYVPQDASRYIPAACSSTITSYCFAVRNRYFPLFLRISKQSARSASFSCVSL